MEAFGRMPKAAAGASFVVATTAVNASNFALHAVVSRLLGPVDYGALGSLLTVMVVLSVPLSALQTAISHGVAVSDERGHSIDLVGLTRRMVLLDVGSVLLWAAASAPLTTFLHLRSAAPVLLVGTWILPTVVGAVWSGALIGGGHFREVALSQLLGAGAIRLGSTVLLISAGFGVSGGVLGSAIGAAATTLLVWPGARRRYGRDGVGKALALDEGVRSVVAVGAITLLTSLDTWLARHYLSADAAGDFAAAATAGRIPLFASLAIITVVFPRLARAYERSGAGAGQLTLRCLAAIVVVAGGSAVVLTVASGLAVQLIFGPKFAAASSVLIAVAWADAAVAVLSAAVYVHLAARSNVALIPCVGCVGVVAATALFHRSGVVLGLDMLVVNAGCLVASVVPLLLRRWLRRTDDEGARVRTA